MINIESVVRTFRPLWRTVQGFTAQDLGNNMMVFIFEDDSNLERVLQSEPWMYDKHLVSFQRVEADTSIAEMECRWVLFWIQIHNLPVQRMNHDTAMALGRTLGVVEKVVESEEGKGREGCMRVRVKLDISKPLCRGRKAWLMEGKETWISFRYERLPNLCYWCGLLTHGERDCEKWLRSKGPLRREEQQYGPWMRASVEKPIRRVEVKVASRSDIPRWGKTQIHDEKSGGVESPHDGNGAPTVVKPFMDFSQFKETLPKTTGADILAENLGQQIPRGQLSDLNSSPILPESVEINEEPISLHENSSS